jgi:hypothetical protein
LFTKKKIAVKYERKLFTKKINGIVLGDMTRCATYPNLQNTEAHYDLVLLYFCASARILLLLLLVGWD